MIQFVKVIKSKIISGIKNLLIEIFKDDIQEHIFLTIPNIETIALKDEKVCLHETDKNGSKVLFGTPLKTDIDDGETKINAYNGETKLRVSSIYMDKNGQIEIGFQNFKSIVNSEFLPIYNAHSHSLDLSKLTALPTSNVMTAQHLTENVKLQ